MRRSSWVLLGLAGLILVFSVLLYAHAGTYPAPPMNNQTASRIIDKGRAALERRDVDAIMDLMAPTARVLDRRPDELRTLLTRAMEEVQGHLDVTVRNLMARQEQSRAVATFDMDIGQKSLNAVYYPNLHVRLILDRVPISHWLGLFTTEEWKIAEVTTDPPFETTPP